MGSQSITGRILSAGIMSLISLIQVAGGEAKKPLTIGATLTLTGSQAYWGINIQSDIRTTG